MLFITYYECSYCGYEYNVESHHKDASVVPKQCPRCLKYYKHPTNPPYYIGSEVRPAKIQGKGTEPKQLVLPLEQK